MCGERWRERVLSSSIMIALRKKQEFILLFEWLPVGDDLVMAVPLTVLTRIFKFQRPLWMIHSRILHHSDTRIWSRISQLMPYNRRDKRTLQVNSNRGFQDYLHHGIASIFHGICVQWPKQVNTKVKKKLL